MTASEAQAIARVLSRVFDEVSSGARSAQDAPGNAPTRATADEAWSDGYALGWSAAAVLVKITAAQALGEVISPADVETLTPEDASFSFHNAHCVRRDELHLGGCPIE